MSHKLTREIFKMKNKMEDIRDYAEKIKRMFHPQKVILFGSYAYGKPTRHSDVDLLVIMKTKMRPIEQAVLIRTELPSSFPLDLIVKTSPDVKKRLEAGDFFLRTILEQGKLL